MNDFTKTIADHETTQGADRLAREDHPAYRSVLLAAASVDMDRDLLMARVERIVVEVKDLANEALRIRDQHEAQIDAMKSAPAVEAITVDTVAAGTFTFVIPPIPPTLVHWIRRQIALHPVAADHHPLLTEPTVKLGDLRAWLAAYDRSLPETK